MFDSALDLAQDLARSPAIPWKGLMIGGMLVNSLFRNYARYRQIRAQYRPEPSAAAKEAGIVDTQSLQKAQSYTRAKLAFAVIDSFFDTAMNVAQVYFTVPTKVWSFWTQFAGAHASSLGAKSVIFLTAGTLTVAGTLVELPFSLYNTFVIEEKFGFNKQSLGSFLGDTAKSLLLSVSLGGLFVVVIQMILDKFGRSFIPYAMTGIVGLMAVAPVFMSLVIEPMFYKKEQLAAGELRTRIEELAASHGFPNDKIMVIDGSSKSSHSNAYFTGFPWFKEIVLYDTLITANTTDEVIAILAHELGHWKGSHVPIRLGLSLPNVLLNFVSWLLLLDNKHFQRSMGFPAVFPPNSFANVGVLLYDIMAPFELLFSYTSKATMRHCEFGADKFAVQQGLGGSLRSGLIAHAKSNLTAVDYDPLYATLTLTHPTPLERIDRIDELMRKAK